MHWGGGGEEFNHTDTTGSDISCNHDWRLSGLELVQNPISLVLLLVSVDGECWPSVLAKEARDVISDTLGSGEDKDLVLLVLHDLLHVLGHLVALLELRDDFDNLGNAVVGRKLKRTDVDLNEVVLEIGGKSAHLLRPGSGPHASLSVWSNLSEDLANLWLETHVQHAVSFIENQVGNATKVGLSGLKHIDKTSWGSNDDLDTLGEVADLSTLWNTTVNAGVANAGRLSEFAHLLLNLDSKLTGWGKDKNNWSITWCEEWLGIDVNNSWQAVGKGFSGSSLGNTDDVTTGEGHWPSLRLNGSWGWETLSLDLAHNVCWETGLVESLDWLWDVGSSDGDAVKSTELGDILVRAGSDGWILLVERLLELWERVDIPLLLLEVVTELTHAVTALAAAAVTAAATVAATTTSRVAVDVSTAAASSVSTTAAAAVAAATMKR